ncbi:ORF20 [Ranid herpesvirus 2]|uniref:ORF20 n=1 Tax=Ranid herpesvirus 2 TaxID=389214 RepID=Q14W86_9VIRU|nr:ORF20 [Ranid herpesvirus 2]ABG25679.1 ORF20 [Ranid herpesvirus 2]
MASSVVCGVSLSDLEHELSVAMDKVREEHLDWPDLVQALMWHEVMNHRVKLMEFVWYCKAVAEQMSFFGKTMGQQEQLRELHEYAVKKYDLVGSRRKEQRVELYNFVYFLKYHIPNYRKFVERHGVSPLTGYAYDELHQDEFVNGQIKIKERKRELRFPRGLREPLEEWKNSTKNEFDLVLNTSFDLEAFNAKTRGEEA